MRSLVFNKTPNLNPIETEQIRTPKKGKGFWPFLPIGIILILLAFAGSKFWERYYNDPNLDRSEVEEAQREAEEVKERHEVWIQYVLIADTDGKRPCLRCPGGIPEVTLKAGEIYKYGITTQGEARYTKAEYKSLRVSYFEEFYGTYLECKEMEVNKIVAYRFLPQSKKPEVKLLRPPGNANKS